VDKSQGRPVRKIIKALQVHIFMKVLIVDDERAIRYSLKEILEMENYQVETAENGEEGLQKAEKEKYDAIFCDIKMPVMDGTEMLSRIMEEGIETPVIMVSGHADITTAVDCIKRGAFDFIEKPLDLNRILITLKNATDKAKLVTQTKILKKKVYGQEMIGGSAPIGHLKEMIEKVAPTQASVLITGPNGSGKELVAQGIYQQSARSMMPFVEVNCAAIPSELIDSELFGHKKGSFTSAIRDHKGKFEQADGGTIFLDEIGDMSLAAQAKVLRVLQERKLTPVGGDKEITVDVRVIAATNKNLQEEIVKGNFREDLYHRLSVIVLKVPPLDERKEDIPLLVNYFSERICSEGGRSARPFTPEAIALLQERSWPGNIRELRNVVERLLILGGNPVSESDVKDYVF
jgi:DNA-binding NtrC family response regulator